MTQADDVLAAGFHTVVSTVVDSAGVFRAKQVPARRIETLAEVGLGVSPVWAVFAVDDVIAFTPRFGVVGDWRMRADLDAMADLGGGVAWAPASLFHQDGEPEPACGRGALRRQAAAATAAGLDVLAAIEVECTLFDASGERVGGLDPLTPGPAYGLRPLQVHGALLDDLARNLERAGLPLEQLHAEYGAGQLELSVAPAHPLAAADANVLTRIVLARTARQHDVRVSFSPMPAAGGAGNGAHVHLSATRDGAPLLAGGDGPHGLTTDGAAMLAGVLDGLPDVLALLAGSAVSGLRLAPHLWAGAFRAWGVENREAAVRLCPATPGNPRGANLEVKCIDASANPYVAVATVLGLALDGVGRALPLGPETPGDPSDSSEPVEQLGGDLADSLDRLTASELAGRLLGGPLVEAITAVRRHEVEVAQEDAAALARRLRFAWTP